MAIVDTSFIDPSQRRLVMDTSNIANQIANIVGQRRAEARQDELLAQKKQVEDLRTRHQGRMAQLQGVIGLDSIESKRTQMAKLGQDAIARKEDPSLYTQALEITNPDEFNLYLARNLNEEANRAGMIDQALGQIESALPASMQEFLGKAEAADLERGSPEFQRAGRIALGLEPRAGISAQERIAGDPELTSQVAGSQAQITAAREEAKLEKELELIPDIKSAIKTAEQDAISKGESLSDLNKAKVALPGLVDMTDKLHKLSDVATYTKGGRLFDLAAKELGFGATKGATARAKMNALVKNEILPLLRITFGAAFTETEGDKLEATLMDINATPAEKKATLEAFINQQMQRIEQKERGLGLEVTPREQRLREARETQAEAVTGVPAPSSSPTRKVGRFTIEVVD